MLTTLRRIYESWLNPEIEPFDDLLTKLDENFEATQGVLEHTARLDHELCFNCGPEPAKLRQLSRRLQSAVAAR